MDNLWLDKEEEAHGEEVEVLYENEEVESSEDPPPSEWSSRICFEERPTLTPKQMLYEAGLYKPGDADICHKYVVLKASSEMDHPYFKYPAVTDPGIKEALLEPKEEKIYPDDGQELYLDLCEEMNECPVRLFYKNLVEKEINLKYYCVSLKGIRPMAMALQKNKCVKTLDLTDSHLSRDGSYHLAVMIRYNTCLTKLDLSGCNLGPEGIRQIVAFLSVNKALRILIIKRNHIRDEGVKFVADALSCSLVQQIDLSSNHLTHTSAKLLASAIEYNNILTHLDLSWNSFGNIPRPLEQFFNILKANEQLVEINLAWNSLSARFKKALSFLFFCPNIQYIYLSHNLLCGEAIDEIAQKLFKAKKLKVLDLSFNPMTLGEARKLMAMLKWRSVKVEHLNIDGVKVNEAFIDLKNEILKKPHRKTTTVTHGYVERQLLPTKIQSDKDIILERAQYLCNAPKKKYLRRDFAILIIRLNNTLPEDNKNVFSRYLLSYLKEKGAMLIKEDLIEGMLSAFPGQKIKGYNTCDIEAIVDHIRRKWPDKLLDPAIKEIKVKKSKSIIRKVPKPKKK